MIKIVKEILKVFAENSLFDEGVELIGSWCFALYQKHLGAKSYPLRTTDIDFLIPNPYRGKENKDFIAQLEEIGFKCDFKGDGTIFLWSPELKIEFITPEKGRGSDSPINIKKLGINAIPLRFVSLLSDNHIIVVEDGIKIRVPSPANFCLQKLIIASRRKKTEKSLKDLQQAICTSSIVDSKEMLTLFRTLPKKWRQTILKSLEKAKKELPLLNDDITRLELTLQKN